MSKSLLTSNPMGFRDISRPVGTANYRNYRLKCVFKYSGFNIDSRKSSPFIDLFSWIWCCSMFGVVLEVHQNILVPSSSIEIRFCLSMSLSFLGSLESPSGLLCQGGFSWGKRVFELFSAGVGQQKSKDSRGFSPKRRLIFTTQHQFSRAMKC